jgi:hypothetical protein
MELGAKKMQNTNERTIHAAVNTHEAELIAAVQRNQHTAEQLSLETLAELITIAMEELTNGDYNDVCCCSVCYNDDVAVEGLCFHGFPTVGVVTEA